MFSYEIKAVRTNDNEEVIKYIKSVFEELGYKFEPLGKDKDIVEINKTYNMKRGIFYVARIKNQIIGTAAIRYFQDDICELKRLYVYGNYRSNGIGNALCSKVQEAARNFGYKSIRLDTTLKSKSALRLFSKLKFYEIGRYNSDPYAEIFLEKNL